MYPLVEVLFTIELVGKHFSYKITKRPLLFLQMHRAKKGC